MGGPEHITFKNDTVQVIISVDKEGRVSLQDILPAGATHVPLPSTSFPQSTLPLCEVRLSGEGNKAIKTSKSIVGTYIGSRLRYKSHAESRTANRQTLDVEMADVETGLSVTSHLVLYDGLPFVRASATVTNGPGAAEDVVVTQVSSLVVGALARGADFESQYVVAVAKNTWFREAQWKEQTLCDLGIDDFGLLDYPEYRASVASFSVSNRGTFSTQGHLPMGMLRRRDGAETWLWQVENNGSWRWEVGDYEENLFLAASGPTAIDHEWRERLAPGASFTTVPAAVCHLYGDGDDALAALTTYRRAIRRPHPDNAELPVIFNDYMNCLMGDPTDEKILALVEPVAASGAEYFVIDCGWYADDSNWWDDVGAWEPSPKRFPMGFENLPRRLTDKGLKPGLWIEPEVVGVRSKVARQLPDEAFFQRDGQRIVEKGRYHLDFRHPAVVRRMDGVIDRLVDGYGARYFKFDYNVEVTQGTDVGASSAGSGQLGHNRAYLAWVNALLDRHGPKGLVIENCSSGAQRMDYATLATHSLQSTSDQQDPVRYAAIAAAIHSAVAPEQAATWAYPQPGWSDELNALTVVNALLGRIHLSGRIDIMGLAQLELIYEGVRVYRDIIRRDIPSSKPFWPLGLPGWHDHWLSTGLVAAGGTTCYVSVWRRGGDEASCSLPVKSLKGRDGVKVELLYPAKFESEASWDAAAAALVVRLPKTVCARVYRLTTPTE